MKINIKNYPAEAMKYLLDTCENWEYANWGLLGELGEVASLIAKAKRKGVDVDKTKLMLEIGDCFWFIALQAFLCKKESISTCGFEATIIDEEIDIENMTDNGVMPYFIISDFDLEAKRIESDVIKLLLIILIKYDLSLEDCLQANIDKLADRKERGVIIGDGDYR